MHPSTILIAQEYLGPLKPTLAQHYNVLLGWEKHSPEELAKVEAVVAGGEVQMTAEFMAQLPALRLIACPTVGYDGIDLMAASARGVQVSHGQAVNGEDVADHAIGLLIAHRRRIGSGNALVREGRWHANHKQVSHSLTSSTLGIVGLREIGTAVARRGEAMRMSVVWWGPRFKPEQPWRRAETLLELARTSDHLVIAARADQSNVRMIDRGILRALGPTGLLVNVARGQIIDEDALIESLRNGHLGAAALDVFTSEPTPASRWDDVPNVLLTPHCAGATDGAIHRMTEQLLANLTEFFNGRPLLTPVL